MIKYLACVIPFVCFGQSFAPEPGAIGSTAIHKDSSIFVGWATGVTVERGPQLVVNASFGYASYGLESDAIGPPSGTSVVSLGDGGEAIVTFDSPVDNGPGPDFAVFENGFMDHYLELAFVEVSSDGVNYTRFDAISEIQTTTQLTNFDTVNCRYVHNFAGKYRANYGTPFDLEDLGGMPGLDISAITHIKIVDAVGNIDSQFGSFDSEGTIVNDPYPTMFESGGFDLDAVGIIHSGLLGLNSSISSARIYPNPTNGVIYLDFNEDCMVSVYSSSG
ncbi:T9SS type A sorting domain-containing protein, partial [Crocinitomicaceae bacterium]|nr:T9SS type A sorting domain-containing protein [Crocinitomicaceae bacterium]MDC3253116.1 T9SS type A sorting domain-containing protein [Crocinitomicaceae bacterium]